MLKGETVRVKCEDKDLACAYPWEGMSVPVKIIGIYPKFIVGTVLPHRNPKGMNTSNPYNITISKQDIEDERIIIREENHEKQKNSADGQERGNHPRRRSSDGKGE